MSGTREKRGEDGEYRKPRRIRQNTPAPEADEAYDAWCQYCKEDTEHVIGECVDCSIRLTGPQQGPAGPAPRGPR